MFSLFGLSFLLLSARLELKFFRTLSDMHTANILGETRKMTCIIAVPNNEFLPTNSLHTDEIENMQVKVMLPNYK